MRLKRVKSGIAAVICGAAATPAANAAPLQEFNHIVVIYQENHSFDNLYGLWGEVNGRPVYGLDHSDPDHKTQIRSDDVTPYKCLPQNDVNLTSPPLRETCTDNTGEKFVSAFRNEPFKIDDYIAATDKTCPAPGEEKSAPNGILKKDIGLAGGCTRDLVHGFYNEQYQINEGKQNRYVTGSDAAGLTMGYYDTTKLPIYKFLHSSGAPNYVVADMFFQAAFGGSFLNHQWLIAAATPEFAGALNDGCADDLHSTVDVHGRPTSAPNGTSCPEPAKTAEKKDSPSLTASCYPPAGRPPTPANVACGDYDVSSIQPWYPPYKPNKRRLPPLTNPTIGDRLSDAKIDWAWYSGGWSDANGDKNKPGWTNGTDKLFQYQHQPFNYYKNYAPGTEARRDHLRDEEEFKQAAQAGNLRQVSFVKLIGEENEHPGYASVTAGSTHLVDLIQAIVNGPDGEDALIIVAYDEFGGSWDHVPPPPYNRYYGRSAHDEWGPGTRIPALLIAKKFAHSAVDHAEHDTTSILKLIEERFHLEPLSSRDRDVGSLKTALEAAEEQAEEQEK